MSPERGFLKDQMGEHRNDYHDDPGNAGEGLDFRPIRVVRNDPENGNTGPIAQMIQVFWVGNRTGVSTHKSPKRR